MGLAVTVAISLTLYILAPQAIGLFNQDPGVLHYGVLFLRLLGPLDFLVCFNQIYAGALRGIGDATAPTIIMLASFVVFRQIYLAVTKALNIGFVSVALAYPMGWIMCSLLLLIRYRRSALFRDTPMPQASTGAHQ